MTLLLEEYLAWLRDARGLAASTVVTNEKHLADFFRRMGEFELAGVTIRDLDRYATRLALAGLAASTRRARLIAIRSFFAFLVSRGHLSRSPAATLALPRGRVERNPDVFEPAEIERLIQVEPILPPCGKKEPKRFFDRRSRLHPIVVARDRAMIALVYELGLRPGEVALLQRQDFRSVGESWTLTIRNAKHSIEPITLPVDKALVAPLLLDYILQLERAGIQHPALFPALTKTRFGSRNIGISGDDVRRILRRRIELAGLSLRGRQLSGHSLRRSRATHAYQAEEHIERVQILLRHKDLSSTKSYIRMARLAVTHRQLKASLPWISRRLGHPSPR